MTDDKTQDDTTAAKPDHEPPAGAETTATWSGDGRSLGYTASAKWLVLRKKEKPAAEIFSVSYVADGDDRDRPSRMRWPSSACCRGSRRRGRSSGCSARSPSRSARPTCSTSCSH